MRGWAGGGIRKWDEREDIIRYNTYKYIKFLFFLVNGKIFTHCSPLQYLSRVGNPFFTFKTS